MHAPGALRHKISGRPFDKKSPDGKTVTLTHQRKMARRAGIWLLAFLRGRMVSDKTHVQHDMMCDTILRGNGYLQAGDLFPNPGADSTVSHTHANYTFGVCVVDANPRHLTVHSLALSTRPCTRYSIMLPARAHGV
jgi:hypothetical protein